MVIAQFPVLKKYLKAVILSCDKLNKNSVIEFFVALVLYTY